jgi:hypothetical protein
VVQRVGADGWATWGVSIGVALDSLLGGAGWGSGWVACVIKPSSSWSMWLEICVRRTIRSSSGVDMASGEAVAGV